MKFQFVVLFIAIIILGAVIVYSFYSIGIGHIWRILIGFLFLGAGIYVSSRMKRESEFKESKSLNK